MIRRYTSAQHRFYDGLVTFLGSLCGLQIGIAVHHFGPQKPYGEKHNIIIQGKSNVSGVEFVFFPYDLMQALANNDWPEVVELHERPLGLSPKSMGFHYVGLRGVTYNLIQSVFIRYFESVRPAVEANHGKDVQSWPTVWNFGRVVRNAFAHGKIHFDKKKAQPVTWRTLTYSPADEGRQIVFQDLAVAEVILLMEEMDTAV